MSTRKMSELELLMARSIVIYAASPASGEMFLPPAASSFQADSVIYWGKIKYPGLNYRRELYG